MYATFKTKKEAQAFTDSIHEYLTKNRPDYNAEKWSDVTKHQSEELYAVPLSPETIPGDYSVIKNLDGWIAEHDERNLEDNLVE